MGNRFNLVDEPWIPIAGRGRVSLKTIFSDPSLQKLGGNAVQKLALLKLFLAIAHRSSTPEDDNEWREMGPEGLSENCSRYLDKNMDHFWLYGENPFLQMLILKELVDSKKKQRLPVQVIGRNYIPDLPSENDTLLFESQADKPLTDAEKAVFLVSIMNYSLGGKRTAKDVKPLSPGYQGKSNSSKAAPSLGGYIGYLNAHLIGETIQDTIWLNLFTQEQLDSFDFWTEKELIPPWEQMPKGEDDPVARRIKNSFMSTLCSMSRFVLLVDEGIIYMEGIQYPGHKQGWREPFISSNAKGQMLWLNTSKKPWRNLPAILNTAFGIKDNDFFCPQVSMLLQRARIERDVIGVWAGGLQVRGTAGDQSVKQTDDYIESQIMFRSSYIGEFWFRSLVREIKDLETLSWSVEKAAQRYYYALGKKKDATAKKIPELFWNLCERHSQQLVDSCNDQHKRYELRKTFAGYAMEAFNRYCSNQSPKQMVIWAKEKPNLGFYLATDEKEGGVEYRKE
jgi:CRISPR system Cascade subunit CasA